MTHLRARWLAWSLWSLSVVLGAGMVVLSLLNRRVDVPWLSGPAANSLFAVVLLAFTTVGALVATRRPRNPIGWVLDVAGTLLALVGASEAYGIYALYTEPGSLPGGELGAWVSAWVVIPPLFATPTVLFLLFPDGRLLTRRWRPVLWVSAGAAGVTTALVAAAPGPLGDEPFEEVANPFGIQLVDSLVVLSTLGFFAMVLGVVAAAVSMVLRLRRSRGVERQQLKWLASAAAFFALATVVGIASYYAGQNEAGALVILLAFIPVPSAAGLAILRYRLYDVDVVINRTLVYGSLTALLAGTYLGLVLLLQLLLSPLTSNNALAVAGSTLAVAALFRPARSKIQAAVDRRFYRRRYDAARTLERFSARLRDEIDLDALGAELRAVVSDAMQPAHVALWLRTPSDARSSSLRNAHRDVPETLIT